MKDVIYIVILTFVSGTRGGDAIGRIQKGRDVGYEFLVLVLCVISSYYCVFELLPSALK